MEQICIYLAIKAHKEYFPEGNVASVIVKENMFFYGRPVAYPRETAPPRSISALYYHYLDTYPPLRDWTKREFEA